MNEMLIKLYKEIEHQYGLSPRPSWDHDGEKALHTIAFNHNIDIQTLPSSISKETWLLREFAGHLTVEETYFLRHSEHFDYAVSYIQKCLPFLSMQTPFTFWSAGCASGEEAYSFAMALDHQLGTFPRKRVKIIGNDINHLAINKAKTGVYVPWSFRDTPDWLQSNYFQAINDGKFKLNESIHNLVEFEHLSILEMLHKQAPDSIDIIFFRNVAIYLTHTAQKQVFEGFRRVLKPGGLLFLAPADPRPQPDMFTQIDHSTTSVYRNYPSHERIHPIISMESTIPKPPLFTTVIDLHETKQEPAANENASIKPNLMQSAQSEYEKGNLDEALDYINQLIDINPHHKEVYHLKGKIHLSLLEYNQAVDEFRRCLFIDNSNYIVRFWYAFALKSGKHHRQALKQIETLIHQLSRLPAPDVLPNSSTRVGDLLQATYLLRDELE